MKMYAVYHPDSGSTPAILTKYEEIADGFIRRNNPPCSFCKVEVQVEISGLFFIDRFDDHCDVSDDSGILFSPAGPCAFQLAHNYVLRRSLNYLVRDHTAS